MKALIFDCDGVLIDTERDGHRVAFNEGFKRSGIDAEWDEALYGQLLEVAGGKERMRHYFEQVGWPAAAGEDRDAYIAGLHKLKTAIFGELLASGALPAAVQARAGSIVTLLGELSVVEVLDPILELADAGHLGKALSTLGETEAQFGQHEGADGAAEG